MDPLPQADLYILSNVIHDWSKDKIDQLLSKVYDSLNIGKFLICHCDLAGYTLV